ncbi:MAG: choice-of-anchor D domain-containing protein [Rhodanobacteraceae bacterium]
MKKRMIVLALALMLPIAAAAHDGLHVAADDRAANVAPDGGSITTYSDLPAFLSATAAMTLTVENFSAHDAFNVSPCYEPVNRDAGQPATSFLAPTCFYPGDVAPGFAIRSDLDWTSGITNPWSSPTGPGLFFVGANAQGLPSNAVGATYSAAMKTFLDFSGGPVAVSFDAYDVAAGSPVTIDVYDTAGAMVGTTTVFPASPPSAAFVGFTSTAPIARVTLHSASGVSQMLGNLHFGGRAGTLAVDAERVDFGARAIGAAASQPVGVSNEGDTDLLVASIDAPAAPFALASDACSGTTLAPGGNCTVSVGFDPGLERNYAATLAISANGATREIALHARGVLPTLSAAPASLDFGSIAPGETAGPLAITLANTTAVAVEVGTVAAPSAPFAMNSSTCGVAPFTLAPGETCSLAFSFAPTATGAFNARVTFESNDPSSPREVVLRGRAGDDSIFADGFDS